MFDKIKEYLTKMRKASYEIYVDSDAMLQFVVITEWTEKLFTVHYRDGQKGDSLDCERPRRYHYYLQFEQENYPFGGNFVTITEWKWYPEEEDVLDRIKILKNRYKR